MDVFGIRSYHGAIAPSESDDESESDIELSLKLNPDAVVPPTRRVKQKTRDPNVFRGRIVRRSSEVLGEKFGGMEGVEVRRLFRMCLPLWFFNLMFFAAHAFDVIRNLDGLELFAGAGEIMQSFRDAFYKAAGYDKSWDEQIHNFNSTAGFVHARVLTVKLQVHGCNWYATVCSTWVWMSRSSTKRSIKCAQGNLRSRVVRDANAQVSRMVLLALLSLSRRCYWALEQPSSSVMEFSSAIRHLKRLDSRLLGAKWSRTYMHMGSYGAHTTKPKRHSHPITQ